MGLFAAGMAVLLFGPLQPPAAPAENESLAVYTELIEQYIDDLESRPLTNDRGFIVWNLSYVLDSLLNVYELTGDEGYLDRFLPLAKAVMEARAVETGARDYRGRLSFGWLTGGHYTYGGPVTLLDDAGRPAIELETTLRSHNNETTVEVIRSQDEAAFALRVVAGRYSPPRTFEYDGLTLDSVEARVNAFPWHAPPSDAPARTAAGKRFLKRPNPIRVRVVGTAPPAVRGPFTPDSARMAIHGHHTGRIVTPLARFCALVLEGSGPERFRTEARNMLRGLRATMAEHDQLVRESGDGQTAWTVFERRAPFWCDGVVEPHNTLAASGSAYVALHRATGEAYFRERAAQFARLLQRHHGVAEDDTWVYHYWWGEMRTGFLPGNSPSANLPAYSGQDVMEDISHFQLSMLFFLDCYRPGIVLDRDHLVRWGRTFHERMLKRDAAGWYVAAYVNGSGRGVRGWNNHVLAGMIELSRVLDDRRMYRILRTLFHGQYTEKSSSGAALLSWSALARAEAHFSACQE